MPASPRDPHWEISIKINAIGIAIIDKTVLWSSDLDNGNSSTKDNTLILRQTHKCRNRNNAPVHLVAIAGIIIQVPYHPC